MVTTDITSGGGTLTLMPHRLSRKFESAFLKMHWALKKKGMRLMMRKDRQLSMYEFYCVGDRAKFAGMVIAYDPAENQFEVFEYQAGPKKELWVYGYYKSPMAALKKLIAADIKKNPIRIY